MEDNILYIHRGIENFNMDSAAMALNGERDALLSMIQSSEIDALPAPSDSALEMFEMALSENDIMSSLNESFTSALAQNIEEAISRYDYESMASYGTSSLERYLETGDLAELDKIFVNISRASKMMGTSNKELIAAITGRNGFKAHRSLPKLNAQLTSILNAWEGKELTLNQSKMASLIGDINTLVSGISNNSLSKISLIRRLNKIFKKDLGDHVITNVVNKKMGKEVGSLIASLAGDGIKIELDGATKNLINNSNISGGATVGSSNGIQISMDENGDTFNATMNINTTWSKGFSQAANINMALEEVQDSLTNLILNGMQENVYNAIALEDSDPSGVIAFKNLAVVKTLVTMELMNNNLESPYFLIDGKFISFGSLLSIILRGEDLSAFADVTIDAESMVAEYNSEIRNYRENAYWAEVRSSMLSELLDMAIITIRFNTSNLSRLL